MTLAAGATSPLVLARWAGAIYSLVFVTGIAALVLRGRTGMIAGLVAGVLYLVVTILFYRLFKPAGPWLSLLAALVSVAGIVVGPLRLPGVHPLVFFGFYCLLIATLIARSTFLPRWLAALMAFAGLGWLTFFSPSLVKALYPYNLGPGIVGEAALTVWLLVKGVDAQRWREQAPAR